MNAESSGVVVGRSPTPSGAIMNRLSAILSLGGSGTSWWCAPQVILRSHADLAAGGVAAALVNPLQVAASGAPFFWRYAGGDAGTHHILLYGAGGGVDNVRMLVGEVLEDGESREQQD